MVAGLAAATNYLTDRAAAHGVAAIRSAAFHRAFFRDINTDGGAGREGASASTSGYTFDIRVGRGPAMASHAFHVIKYSRHELLHAPSERGRVWLNRD